MAQISGDGFLPLPNVRDKAHYFVTLIGAYYDDYLWYQAAKQQSSSSIVLAMQLNNSFAYLTIFIHWADS